jgi:hypothetical protein
MADLQITQEITVDLDDRSPFEYVVVKQGDKNSRIVAVTLLQNKQVFTIPTGTTARIKYYKPDGNEILNDCTISGNKILVTYTEQMLAASGTGKGEIMLTKDSKELKSATFYTKIVSSVYKTDGFVSDKEFLSMRTVINDMDQAAQAATTNANIAKQAATNADNAALEAKKQAEELRKEIENDLELERDKIVNVHVWEKISSKLIPNLAAEKALILGNWPAGVVGVKPNFTISYSDAISEENGEVILADPVKTYHVTATSDCQKLNFLRGKYVKKESGNDGVFKVATNATFDVVTEKNGIEVYVMKCYNAQHVDSAGYTSEYVTSANRSAYPDSGLQNEYRYEYRGTIGQALTKVSTISN